jgi:putative transposase
MIRQEIDLDEWVIMPNHLHGIIVINTTPEIVGAQGLAPLRRGIACRRPKSLSTLVAGFKMAATKRINLARNAPGTPVWQRNYYEHIIRDEPSLQKIRQYIQTNPIIWDTDQLHPASPSKW